MESVRKRLEEVLNSGELRMRETHEPPTVIHGNGCQNRTGKGLGCHRWSVAIEG